MYDRARNMSSIKCLVKSPPHGIQTNSNSRWTCGDYRPLISVTLPNQKAIARILDFSYRFVDVKVFRTLDVIRAQHQIPVAEQDIPKTAVITSFGLFEFCFDLYNAVQIFELFLELFKMTNALFYGRQRQNCFIFFLCTRPTTYIWI